MSIGAVASLLLVVALLRNARAAIGAALSGTAPSNPVGRLLVMAVLLVLVRCF